jgi:hypothetical protein
VPAHADDARAESAGVIPFASAPPRAAVRLLRGTARRVASWVMKMNPSRLVETTPPNSSAV